MPANKVKAHFVEPMLLLRTNILGADWRYELKLDGYRALAIKTNGKVQLRSRNNNDFNLRYPAVVEALRDVPGETVIDGEVVAFDDSGRPSFNRLQNYGSTKVPIFYYAFDCCSGHSCATMCMCRHSTKQLVLTVHLPV